MAWTSERVELLTKLWKEGNSASQIAKEMGQGVSRNAVIGKIHRLGLSERNGNYRNSNNTQKIKNNVDQALKKTFSVSNKNNAIITDGKIELDVKIVKKRGRKPGQKSAKKNLGVNNKISSKIDEIISENIFVQKEINTSSELEKKALASMKAFEKKAKKINLMELTEKTCKWPIGDPATDEFWFCGHQAEHGKPYCETHVAIAFQPVSSRRERKQK